MDLSKVSSSNDVKTKMSDKKRNVIRAVVVLGVTVFIAWLCIKVVSHSVESLNIMLITTLVLAVFLGFTAAFAPNTTFVVGPLYWLCTGISIAALCHMASSYYKGAVFVALFCAFNVWLSVIVSYGFGLIRLKAITHSIMYAMLFVIMNLGLIIALVMLLSPDLIEKMINLESISNDVVTVMLSLWCSLLVFSCFVVWLEYVSSEKEEQKPNNSWQSW